MKKRQKFTVTTSDFATKIYSDTSLAKYHKTTKSKFSQALLEKNATFLENYNKLFRKPSLQQVSNADHYFKTSLRSEPFDLIRDLNLQSHLDKTSKSQRKLDKERVTQRKPRSVRTLLSPRFPSAPGSAKKKRFSSKPRVSFSIKDLYTSDIKENESDTASESSQHSVTPKNELIEAITDVLSEAASTPRIEADITKRLDSILNGNMEGEDLFGDDVIHETEEEMSKMADGGGEDELQRFDDEEIDEHEGEDEEMKEVEQMIETAATELQKVVEENESIVNALNEEEEEASVMQEEDGPTVTPLPPEGGDGSYFKFDPKIDAAVLRELEDAEKQAKQTAKIIEALKQRVSELLKKDRMTAAESKELEQKSDELRAQMKVFEEKTKRIQFLIGQTNLFDDMVGPQPTLQVKNKEDVLPKVIVCGFTENNMPKIFVCDDKKCTPRPKSGSQSTPRTPRTQVAHFQQKLNECLCMQDKLATENANLEGKRYQLQSEIVNKDTTVECLQKQLCDLKKEMRMVCTQNQALNQQLQSCATSPICGHTPRPLTAENQSRSSSPNKMPSCGGKNRICPADIQQRLQEYADNTQNLEKQLGMMEAEVKTMRTELVAVQKEREHLEHHRKRLCPPVPLCAMPAPCMPPQSPCCSPCPPCDIKPGSPEQQLRELREQYNRLQDDFKGKLTEVAGLRADNEKLKENASKAEAAKKTAEDKFRELDVELKKLKAELKANKAGGNKEQLIEQEQQLNVAKQRFREAQDELEELRALVNDQQTQLDDYRNKYLEAQQKVEEQRRQMDLMEIENQRVSEQVNLEIQRVKNQFQEKVQELMPLPDILKSTQLKLQEAQQMHLLAEKNNEAIGRELQMYKDKINAMTNQMEQVRSDQQLGADEKATLKQRIDDLANQVEELMNENDKLKSDLEKAQEKSDEFERLAESRIHEITQLESQLESLREETARQVARTKDRCEIVRRSMQNQISDMERQLAQSRALAKAAQNDRDDIRQKMQAQISNLNENFEDAQMRIRNLQGHVNFLKNNYGNIIDSSNKSLESPKEIPSPCNCSADY